MNKKKELDTMQGNDISKISEIAIIAIKGKTYQLTRSFIQKFRDDSRNISTTIDSKNNVSAIFVYKQPKELSKIYSDIMNLSYVKSAMLVSPN